MNSVLQDWVMELPLREQRTLLTAVRGGKYPLTVGMAQAFLDDNVTKFVMGVLS